jgi:hypothetical protein
VQWWNLNCFDIFRNIGQICRGFCLIWVIHPFGQLATFSSVSWVSIFHVSTVNLLPEMCRREWNFISMKMYRNERVDLFRPFWLFGPNGQKNFCPKRFGQKKHYQKFRLICQVFVKLEKFWTCITQFPENVTRLPKKIKKNLKNKKTAIALERIVVASLKLTRWLILFLWSFSQQNIGSGKIGQNSCSRKNMTDFTKGRVYQKAEIYH